MNQRALQKAAVDEQVISLLLRMVDVNVVACCVYADEAIRVL